MADIIEIPHNVDDPIHFLLWQVDEVAPIGLGLILGVLTEHVFPFLIVGLILVSLYRRFRDGRPDGFILHYFYWIGLMKTRSKTAPNPYIRRFYP